jgi:hypothetical protein
LFDGDEASLDLPKQTKQLAASFMASSVYPRASSRISVVEEALRPTAAVRKKAPKERRE